MMEDHDYTLASPLPEDSAIDFDPSADLLDQELTHMPTKAPVSKKKKRDKPCEESAMESILKAVYENPNSANWSYEHIVKEVDAAYGPRSEHAAAVGIELRQRVRKQGETMHTLRDDIYEKVAIVYGDRTELEQDCVAVEIFTNAMTDADIIQKLLEEKPRTLACAYDIAHRYETTKRAARAVTQMMRPGLGPRGSAARAAVVLEDAPASECDQPRTTDVNFIMADTARSTEVILGHPFLRQSNACLDYGRREISLFNVKVPRYDPNYQPAAAHVVRIARTTVLEPGREYVVPGSASLRSQTGGDLMLSPTKAFIEKHCVLVAHAVVQPLKSAGIPIRVFNPGSTPVTLKRGTVAGVLQPAEVVATLESAPTLPPSKPGPINSVSVPSHLQVMYGESCSILSEGDGNKLAHLLHSYADIFSTGPTDLGRTNIVQHDIQTLPGPPVKQPPRRMAADKQLAADQQLQQSLDAEQLERSHQLAREALGKASERAKRQYDKNICQTQYLVGSAVWYLVKGTKRVRHKVRKFLPSYEGPYFIVGQLDDLVYQIQKGPRAKIKVVHHDKLKPFHSRALLDNSWVFQRNDTPTPLEVSPPVSDVDSDTDFGPLQLWDTTSEDTPSDTRDTTSDFENTPAAAREVAGPSSPGPQPPASPTQPQWDEVGTRHTSQSVRRRHRSISAPLSRSQRTRRAPDKFGDWLSH
uniref:Integrase p58-like C-terminal domain-containing protein n=1 Tax=Knipowitschia caucasica TaxID=637954 RepID=A0AAV2K6V2_KNICA